MCGFLWTARIRSNLGETKVCFWSFYSFPESDRITEHHLVTESLLAPTLLILEACTSKGDILLYDTWSKHLWTTFYDAAHFEPSTLAHQLGSPSSSASVLFAPNYYDRILVSRFCSPNCTINTKCKSGTFPKGTAAYFYYFYRYIIFESINKLIQLLSFIHIRCHQNRVPIFREVLLYRRQLP